MYPMKYFLNDDYQPLEIFGVEGLFTNMRVERDSLPNGFYKYSIREGGEDPFASVAKEILVNHTGDFICKEPLKEVEEQGEVNIEDEYSFLDTDIMPEQFFGVSFKDKLVDAVDEFCYDNGYFEYMDNAPADNPREAMREHIALQLNSPEGVAAVMAYVRETSDENLQGKELAEASYILYELEDLSRELNKKNSLDQCISSARQKVNEISSFQNKETDIPGR